MVGAGTLNDTLKEHLISRYSESWLTELIISYFTGILCIFFAYLTHLFRTFFEFFQKLLGCLCVEDVVCVKFEERDEFSEDCSVALRIAIIFILFDEYFIHADMKISDLNDR